MNEEEYLKLKAIIKIRDVYVQRVDRMKTYVETTRSRDTINKICHKIEEIDEMMDMLHHRLLN